MIYAPFPIDYCITIVVNILNTFFLYFYIFYYGLVYYNCNATTSIQSMVSGRVFVISVKLIARLPRKQKVGLACTIRHTIFDKILIRQVIIES